MLTVEIKRIGNSFIYQSSIICKDAVDAINVTTNYFNKTYCGDITHCTLKITKGTFFKRNKKINQ